MKWDEEGNPIGNGATQWIHLQDALDKGSISKMECYDAIALGYCPEHLTIRDSRYKHLIK
jgi:hypothetical protein